jgi:tartrate-resistant acid phosphatase type 5
MAFLLMAGATFGWWWFSGDARPDPAVAPTITPTDPDRFRVVAVGDIGLDGTSPLRVRDAVRKTCAERGCDAIVLLGDNLYPSGMTAPDDPLMDDRVGDRYAGLGVPVYLVLGNHDYGPVFERRRGHWQVAWAHRTDGFELPAPTWTANAGFVGLWGLDTTELMVADASRQREWIDRTVRASTARVRVAFGHHPYKSNGKHGNAGDYGGFAGIPLMDGRAVASFYQDQICGRFDLVITGHDHNLQWIEACGTTFVVSGSGAQVTPLRDRGTPSVFSAEELGFVWVSIDRDGIDLAFIDDSARLLFEGRRGRDGSLTGLRGGSTPDPEIP